MLNNLEMGSIWRFCYFLWYPSFSSIVWPDYLSQMITLCFLKHAHTSAWWGILLHFSAAALKCWNYAEARPKAFFPAVNTDRFLSHGQAYHKWSIFWYIMRSEQLWLFHTVCHISNAVTSETIMQQLLKFSEIGVGDISSSTSVALVS